MWKELPPLNVVASEAIEHNVASNRKFADEFIMQTALTFTSDNKQS